MKWVLYFFKKGWRTHFRLTCKQAWLEELLRFAALWLGKKTQTFSGTSQKPGQPRPCKTMLPGAHALKTFVPPFLPTQLTVPGSPTMISLRMRLQWYLVYSRPIPSNKIGERRLCRTRFFFFGGRADLHRLLHWLTVLLFSLKFDKLLTTDRGLTPRISEDDFTKNTTTR